MAFTIRPDQGRWVVLHDGVPVFRGDYRQVEDWLDRAENRGAGEQQPEAPKPASPLPAVRRRSDTGALPAW